jgi:hypothetical protein
MRILIGAMAFVGLCFAAAAAEPALIVQSEDFFACRLSTTLGRVQVSDLANGDCIHIPRGQQIFLLPGSGSRIRVPFANGAWYADRSALAVGAAASRPVRATALISTGTGFAVGADVILTSEHVISGCNEVFVQQGDARVAGTVIASDRTVDLAAIRVKQRLVAVATFRQSPPIRAGEQAVVFGFPLSGALAVEGNLTVGHISALRGLRDDPDKIQITTPIQPGNSGGPLLDMSGHVVGVVAAKLDAMKVMGATGDIPQNVNFAVALGSVTRFLQQNGLHINTAASAAALPPADVGDRAKSFTHLIGCVSRAAQGKSPKPSPPQPISPPQSDKAATPQVVSIKERPALACVARTTLERLRAISGQRDGSFERQLEDDLRSGRCRHLAVGSEFTVIDITFFAMKVTAPWLDKPWWISTFSTMSQKEKDDLTTALDALADEIADDARKREIERLRRQQTKE